MNEKPFHVSDMDQQFQHSLPDQGSGDQNVRMSIENLLQKNPIDLLRAAVTERRPILRGILAEHGTKTVLEYSRGFNHVSLPDFSLELSRVLESLHNVAAPILGDDVASRLQERLESKPVLQTGDHHGPLLHSLFVSGNILMALPDLMEGTQSVVPVAAFGDVPLNNVSYPIGFRLTERLPHRSDTGAGPAPYGSVSLFPDKKKRMLVAAAPAYGQNAVKKAVERVGELQQLGVITPSKADVIVGVLEQVFANPRTLEQPDYASQITRINADLWRHFFADRCNVDMAYIQMESIVAHRLDRMLADGEDNMITATLLDPVFRDRVMARFDGIPGCWSADGQGTRFFWGIPKGGKHDGQAIALHAKDGFLVDPNHECLPPVELSADSLRTALREGRIKPGMFLSFGVMQFLAGIRCFGGFMQTDYLTQMRAAWSDVLRESGEAENAVRIDQLPVANYSVGPLAFFVERNTAVASGLGREAVGAGGFDLIANPITQDDLFNLARHTLGDLNAPGLPDAYRIVYGTEADSRLCAITPDVVIRETLPNLIRE